MQFYEKTRELKTALDQMSKQAQLQSKQLSSYEAELIPLREIEKIINDCGVHWEEMKLTE